MFAKILFLPKNLANSSNIINNQPTQKPNYKTWLIVLIVIVALAAIGFANKRYLQLQYINIKENTFSVNDNIYANNMALRLYPEVGVRLWRLAKSNKGDGSAMMALSGIHLTTKSTTKPKQVLLGRYLGHEIHKVEYTDGADLGNYYMIEVNPDLVKKIVIPDSTIRRDYTYLNDKYYIEPMWVTNKNK